MREVPQPTPSKECGVRCIDHYLDDYITFGAPGTGECAAALDTICRACTDLGVPLAMYKLEGPVAAAHFLGDRD